MSRTKTPNPGSEEIKVDKAEQLRDDVFLSPNHNANKSEITQESEPEISNEEIIVYSEQTEVQEASSNGRLIKENSSKIFIQEKRAVELNQNWEDPGEEKKLPHSPLAKFSFGLLIFGILCVVAEQFVDPTHPTIGFFGAAIIVISFLLALIAVLVQRKKNEKNPLFAKIVLYAFAVGFLGLIIAGVGMMLSGQMFSKIPG